MLIAWLLAPVFLSILLFFPGSPRASPLSNFWTHGGCLFRNSTITFRPGSGLRSPWGKWKAAGNSLVFLLFLWKATNKASSMVVIWLRIPQIEPVGRSLSIFCRKIVQKCQRGRKWGYFRSNVLFVLMHGLSKNWVLIELSWRKKHNLSRKATILGCSKENNFRHCMRRE